MTFSNKIFIHTLGRKVLTTMCWNRLMKARQLDNLFCAASELSHKPTVFCHSSRRHISSSGASLAELKYSFPKYVSNIDPVQLELLKEQCIIVDENDNAVGMASKQACHLLTKDSKGILHRAFSVFLFSSDGNLLLQQRSLKKITYPGFYTNTCCSHPLYTPEEMELQNGIGVKRAAQRRLAIELGIPAVQVPLEKFHYITRIHYCSPYNHQWGEHEIDYILIIKADVTVDVNSNEVKDWCYISQPDFPVFLENLKKQNIPITPWFQLIVNNFLEYWWTNFSDIESVEDKNTIHRF